MEKNLITTEEPGRTIMFQTESDVDTIQIIEVGGEISGEGEPVNIEGVIDETAEDSGTNLGDLANSNAGAIATTYVLNEYTGELIQLVNDENFVAEEEIELISVAAENPLAVDNTDQSEVVTAMMIHQQQQLPSNTNTGSIIGGYIRARKDFGTSTVRNSSFPTMKKMPALLRNSRRANNMMKQGHPEDPLNNASATTTSGGVRDKLDQSSAPDSNSDASTTTTATSSSTKALSNPNVSRPRQRATRSASTSTTASQLVMIEPQTNFNELNEIDLSNVVWIKPMSKEVMEVAQPTYVVYQTANGQQVAQPVQTQITQGSNIIYQVGSSPSTSKSPNGTPRKQTKKESSKKKIVKKGTTKREKNELKCLEPGCLAEAEQFRTILELRQHLEEHHDMNFDYETITFPDEKSFKEWREQYERERMVSFIHRGGTKKISKENTVAYMVCHRSGHYKPAMLDQSKRQRRMKPQGSCKIGGYCTAGIKLLKNLESHEIKMQICHTHYGHPLDSEAIPHLRVNPALKKIILKKFEEGLNFTDVLAYIHHNPDGLEGLRVVDRRAVRNIYEAWKKPDGHRKSAVLESSDDDEEEEDDEQSNEVPKDEPVQDDSIPPEELQKKGKAKAKRFSTNGGASSSLTVTTSVVKTELENNEIEGESDCSYNPPTIISIESIKSLTADTLKRKQKSVDFKNESQKKLKSDYAAGDEIGNEKDNGDGDIIDFEEIKPDLEETGSDSETSSGSEESELEKTVDKLHNHGESGPTILFYKRVGEASAKYGGYCRAFKEEEFCLIIQTPVQRQIMQMFPKVISFEVLESCDSHEHGLKLVYISVLDDFREPIPVVWMISNSIAFKVLNQLFRVLRNHCGELPVNYIMAPRNVEVLKTWSAHFAAKPKILLNEFTARRALRTLLNRNFPNDSIRSSAWRVIEKLLFGRRPEMVTQLKTKLRQILKETRNGAQYLRKMERDWLSRVQEWSFSYRIGATPNLLFVSHAFQKLRKFVSFKGTKMLNKSIDHILKIGYDKCFLRTKRMFKGDQKLSHQLEKIDKLHANARDNLQNTLISEVDEHSWKIQNGQGEFLVFHMQSPCDCKVICKLCEVCMHEYACSCEEFLSNQNMCEHIHKVHCSLKNIPFEKAIDKSNSKESDRNHEVVSCEASEMTLKEEDATLGQENEEIIITTPNDDEHIEALNISEVLQFQPGLFEQEDEDEDRGEEQEEGNIATIFPVGEIGEETAHRFVGKYTDGQIIFRLE